MEVMKIPKNKFWNVKSNLENKKIGEIEIYGSISSEMWWGDEVTPKEFKNDIDKLGEIEELNIYINSDGGEVFAGQAIYNILKRHEAKKNVFIDGIAASIASIIAMAGDTITMPSNSLIMIHNPSTFAWGDVNKFSEMINRLEKVKHTLLEVYENKTGLEKDKISKYMDDETWFTAQEAKELGFIDEVQEDEELVAKMVNDNLFINDIKVDFKNYKNPPQIEVKKEREVKTIKAQKYDLEKLFKDIEAKKNKKFK